ncbi:alpha/beta hydrolase [Lacunimicrobium album]
MSRPLLILTILLGVALGCRVSDPPVLKKNPHSLIYDGFATGNFKENTPIFVREAFAAQNRELSEPVAVVNWQPKKHAQWEVFYATNRGQGQPTSSSRATYTNEVLTTPTFGRAVIQIPSRGRGVDPLLETPRPKWGIIPVSQELKSAPLVEFPVVEPTTPPEFFAGINKQLAASANRDILLFVHGFNVNFDAAILRTAQIAWDMPFNGAIISYAWPTQGGLKNYSKDEPINLASVVPFTDFLTQLIGSVPSNTKINIIVHSMGNRIVMQSLDQLPDFPDGRKPIHNLVLCAPDVGVSDYRKWIPGCQAQCDQITLYTNIGDSALISSKGMHNEQRAGDSHPPIVTAGVDTVDCTRIELNLMGHSYYGSNPDVLTDLFILIKQNKPAAQRSHLKAITETDGSQHYTFENHSPSLYYSWNFEKALQQTASVVDEHGTVSK